MWLHTEVALWIVKCTGPYAAQILVDAVSQFKWIMTQKNTAKAIEDFFKAKKLSILHWQSQSLDLNPTEYALQSLKTEEKQRDPQICEGLAEHHKVGNTACGDVWLIDWFLFMYKKTIFTFKMLVWPVASEPLEIWFQKVDVIPKLLKQYFC